MFSPPTTTAQEEEGRVRRVQVTTSGAIPLHIDAPESLCHDEGHIGCRPFPSWCLIEPYKGHRSCFQEP